MKRVLVLPLVCVAASIFLTNASADDDDNAEQKAGSVLVETTELQKGSLPHIVTGYGDIQPGASAKQTIQAPLSAAVSEIYAQPGEIVEADAPLVRLVPGPKTVSAYSQAMSAYRVATQSVERTEKLVGQHLATDQQLADAQKSQSDARADLAAMQAQGAAGPNVLKAPFRAIVTAVTTSPGAIVSEGSDLLALVKPDGLVLQVGVVPEQAAAIKTGQNAQITPAGDANAVTGQVQMRGSIVDSTNGLVSVEIKLPPGNFLLGQAASAAITTGETKGFIVPHEAILIDDKGQTYVMQAVDMVAKKVAVRVLDSNGEKDAIDGKLDTNVPIILAGNHQLDDGTKLRLAEAGGKGDEASDEKGDLDTKEKADKDSAEKNEQ